MGHSRSVHLAGAIAATLLLATPALAKQSSSINQKENVQLYAGVGDNLVRIALKESLPNAFGGSDIFGRKRDRGFVDIRYMGQTPDGRAIFHRKQVDVFSNETTMSRSGMRFGQATVNTYGNSATVSGFSTGAPAASVQALPADTIEIALDLAANRTITVDGRQIEIISADASGVSYRIVRRN